MYELNIIRQNAKYLPIFLPIRTVGNLLLLSWEQGQHLWDQCQSWKVLWDPENVKHKKIILISSTCCGNKEHVQIIYICMCLCLHN